MLVNKDFLLSKFNTESIGVEIGVWKGEFSKKILELVHPKMLYLCDPWEFMPEYADRWYGGTAAKSNQDMQDIYDNILNEFDHLDNVEVIKDYSNNLLKYIQPNSLDWTYIDGNHSHEFVLQDLNISLELVKTNGMITGDDFERGNEIESAILEFAKNNQSVIQSIVVDRRQFIITVNKETND